MVEKSLEMKLFSCATIITVPLLTLPIFWTFDLGFFSFFYDLLLSTLSSTLEEVFIFERVMLSVEDLNAVLSSDPPVT